MFGKYCFSINGDRYFAVSDSKEETIQEAFKALFEKDKELKLEESVWI